MTFETGKHRANVLTANRESVLQRKCACGGTPGPTGECAACRRKRQRSLQPKFRVSCPGDPSEKEADRMADRITQSSTHSLAPKALRGAHTESIAIPKEVDATLKRSGKPLGEPTRSFMESQFGYNFSQVRVHTDKKAAQSAQRVNALAYTLGSDIVFGAGQYEPESVEGRRLLAHELTHVIQQGEAETIKHSPRGSQSVEAPKLNTESESNQPVRRRTDAEPIQATRPVHQSGRMMARQGGDCPSAFELTWKCGLGVTGCVAAVLAGIAASPTGIGLAAAILAVVSACGGAGTVCGELLAKYMKCQGTEGLAQLANPEGTEAAEAAV